MTATCANSPPLFGDRGDDLVVGITPDDGVLPYEPHPVWETALADILREPGDRLHYENGFGDSWEQTIEALAIELREKSRKYPTCLGDRRTCPAGDCGGRTRLPAVATRDFRPRRPGTR